MLTKYKHIFIDLFKIENILKSKVKRQIKDRQVRTNNHLENTKTKKFSRAAK